MLALVIALDFSRALMSHRMARRHASPALAANALHFSSDLAGSLAVLVGFLFVALGYPGADAIAALFVAALVVIAALRLARQSVDVLMDRASHDAEDRVRAALAALEDPVELRRLRVRHAAGTYFVDLVIAVAPDAGVSQAHAIADHVEERVQRALQRADVVVHVEPAEAAAGDLRERATVAASTIPEVREVHNVRALDVDGHPELSLHVKLPRELSLTQAHDAVERLEAAIKQALPELHRVHTHIEPLSGVDHASTARVRRDRDRARGGLGGRAPPPRRGGPRVGALPRRRAGADRARHRRSARRAAAALRAQPRRRDRGGRAPALPEPRGRDRPHRAGRGALVVLEQVDRRRRADGEQHA